MQQLRGWEFDEIERKSSSTEKRIPIFLMGKSRLPLMDTKLLI